MWLLIGATNSYAADWSVDTGYYRREFSSEDQLGAISANKSLKLVSGQGPSVHASVGWHTRFIQFGLQAQAAYLFLNGQPKQEYVVKGTRIDTSKLSSQLFTIDAVLGVRTSRLSFALAVGPAVQAVAPRWGTPFDYDVVSHVGVKTTLPYSGMDICLEIDLFVVPTIISKNDFTVSPAINVTFGKADEGPPAKTPVVEKKSLPMPKEVTASVAPVEIAEPITATTIEHTEEQVALPEAPSKTEGTKNTSDKFYKPHKRADENAAIKFIAKILRENPKLSVEIQMSMEFNGRIKGRAEEARKQIISHGISVKRVWTALNKNKGQRDIKFVFVVGPNSK